MNISPSFTNLRGHLSYQFSALRMQALRAMLWAKLLGKNTKLSMFPEQTPQKSSNRKIVGIMDIPIEQIAGTVSRQSDFDHKFRPLKSYLRDRWVNTYNTLERDGWSPILVHKIGEHYYVEDGHHRVSVARSIGMAFIEAKVWEHSVPREQTETCQSIRCPERSSSKAYAAG
jgi:hypothetical protein